MGEDQIVFPYSFQRTCNPTKIHRKGVRDKETEEEEACLVA